MTEAKAKTTIFEAFAAVKREVRPVGKDSKNEQQHFNFRGIDAVVNAAAPALDSHGVITAPMLRDIEYATVEVGQRRTPMAHVRVKVAYCFYGPAGDSFEVYVPGEAMDSGDKATAKAMSVAYRIALLQALNLPTSDTDPDAQNYERSAAREDEEVPPPIEVIDLDPKGHPKVVTDDKWLAEIKAEIKALEGRDYGEVLFRRVHEKVEAKGCTVEDGKALQADITGKVAALGKAAKGGSPGDGPPSPDGRHREEVPA